MGRILVPLARGFEEIEAISIIDICRRGGIEVIVAGVENMLVVGAHQITIGADCLLRDVKVDDMDMIVLPGGWGGTKILADNPEVQDLIKLMHADNKLIGAVCAAPYALDSAKVLSGKFTCYPGVEKKINLGSYQVDKAVVRDANIMTSKGVGTVFDFALEIVKELQGFERYDELRKQLLLYDG